MLIEALVKRYEAQIAEAEATLEIYLDHSVGIGEHPQHLDEMDKLFEKIATAKEKLEILREADSILISEIKKAGIYESLWQAFCVFLPLKTVGIMGDFRTYDYLCAIRIVESRDAMTANFAKLDWELLERIATRIINEVKGINRVVYDISNKPPSTIEFE